MLLPVVDKLAKEYIMRYNLACYAGQLGNLKEKRDWLKKTIELADTNEVKLLALTMFLAREIIELKKCKLDGRSPGFGVPYRFYVGIKTEFFDFIEQNRTFDSLGEDLGERSGPGAVVAEDWRDWNEEERDSKSLFEFLGWAGLAIVRYIFGSGPAAWMRGATWRADGNEICSCMPGEPKRLGPDCPAKNANPPRQ